MAQLRTAQVQRKTKETSVSLEVNLDGGTTTVATGIGFFDHMLNHLAQHGGVSLQITAKGDTHVDDHHTVEDVGIVLGQALDKVLGNKVGIERFGFASVPMDDALAQVSIDLSGRPALVFDVAFVSAGGKIGSFDTQLVQEFFTGLVNHGKFNCHVAVSSGQNNHHIAEAIFKALGRALRQAVSITGHEVPSTKGVL